MRVHEDRAQKPPAAAGSIRGADPERVVVGDIALGITVTVLTAPVFGVVMLLGESGPMVFGRVDEVPGSKLSVLLSVILSVGLKTGLSEFDVVGSDIGLKNEVVEAVENVSTDSLLELLLEAPEPPPPPPPEPPLEEPPIQVSR